VGKLVAVIVLLLVAVIHVWRWRLPR
jgi:hypothetical protein